MISRTRGTSFEDLLLARARASLAPALILLLAIATPPASAVVLEPGDMLVAQSFGGTPNGYCNGSVIKVALDGSQEFVADNTGDYCSFRDIVVDANGDAWVSGNDRIAPGHAIFHLDLETGILTSFASAGYLSNPIRIALDPDGNLVVANSNTSTVSAVDLSTGIQSQISVGGLLNGPMGIDVDDDGTIFVADFNPSDVGYVGDVLTVDPDTGAQDLIKTTGQLPKPRGLALGPDGLVYVSSNFGTVQSVYRYDPDTGDEEQVWGSPVQVEDIAFLPDGRLAVVTSQAIYALEVDTGNATPISSNGMIAGPSGIFVLPEPEGPLPQLAGLALLVLLDRRRRRRRARSAGERLGGG